MQQVYFPQGESNPLFFELPSIEYSQFPLWDFFECNLERFRLREPIDQFTLNSLCGISLNATDAVSAVFRGIGGENQRVIPLTPLLQQPL
jgi:hypothetical protein